MIAGKGTGTRFMYDMAAMLAEDLAGGGRGVLIGVISNDGLDESKWHAYIDDSVNGEIACSAGYLFEATGLRDFRSEWAPFLKSKELEFFHATDDIRRPDAEEIFGKLADLVKRTAMEGFVNFLHPKALDQLHPQARKRIGSAFSVATLGCMRMMADVALAQNKLIVYLVEDGNPFAGEVRHFFNEIKDCPPERERYAMGLADTANKRDVIQLQAADLFAWSFTRSYYRNGWVPSIKALVQDKIVRHTMSSDDPMLLAMVHSVYQIESNRERF